MRPPEKRASVLWLAAIALIGLATTTRAADPAWWTSGATPVKNSSPANNYAPANLGQLKYMATQAAAHLNATLSGPAGGAGPSITNMVGAFEPRNGAGETTTQINQFLAQNYDVINLGQLKAVAKPFYDRLIAIGYDTRANLIAQGWTNPPGNYPWSDTTPKSENYQIANLGQLKMVFSFNLTGFTPIILPTTWLNLYGLVGVPPLTDSDGDGASNADEYTHGTDPTKADNPKVQLSVSVFLN